MWAAFSNFEARASFSLTKAFLVPLKGLFVIQTFTCNGAFSRKQSLIASAISSVSAMISMSNISTSTVGTRWRTDSDGPTTSRKAESSLPLSSAVHFTSTRRSFVRVSRISPILTPNSSGFTRILRFFKIARSDQLAPPQRNITIYFMPHFRGNYGLILGGNSDFRALVFFSKNQILGGGADCPIS